MLNNQSFLLNLITVTLLFMGTQTSIAQSVHQPPAPSNGKKIQVLFKPPTGKEELGETGFGATRGSGSVIEEDSTDKKCPQDSSLGKGMIPLAPVQNTSGTTTLTMAKYPILLVYLPETSARQVLLTIQERGGIKHSETFLPITGASGIISLQPSLNSPNLEEGKLYRWQIQLVCGATPTLYDPHVTVWVNRIKSPDPTINGGSILEQASWYAEQGIWYDAVSSLFEATREQPDNQDLKLMWTDFLNSAQLSEGDVNFWLEHLFS